ncbi:DEAD/DEAH box helicase family protein [Streptomyces sp. M19]
MSNSGSCWSSSASASTGRPRCPALSARLRTRVRVVPHQRRAAARVKELLYDGPRRVVLHLPTGVGKTRTGMNLIADHLRQHEPALVVWLARGQELLEQAAAEFERAWSSSATVRLRSSGCGVRRPPMWRR